MKTIHIYVKKHTLYLEIYVKKKIKKRNINKYKNK